MYRMDAIWNVHHSISRGQDRTECFDCIPKPTPKSYPVCTIRSTPSQPIHCIVWGKSYLLRCVADWRLARGGSTDILSEIFGASEDESPEMDHSEDSENGGSYSS